MKLASSGQRTGMMLNILSCAIQPLKNLFLAQNVNSANPEKPWLFLTSKKYYETKMAHQSYPKLGQNDWDFIAPSPSVMDRQSQKRLMAEGCSAATLPEPG